MATRKQKQKTTMLPLASRLVILAIFAIAMGHLEATVVVYIRSILDVIPTPAQFDAAALKLVPNWVIASEQGREAATIVMLVTLAILAGKTLWDRLAVFLYVFGVWDIFYYIALKALIDWPASLVTMDCLFLIPQPWFAPVWIPIAISVGLIVIGIFLAAWQERLAQTRPTRRRRSASADDSADETVEMNRI